MNKSAADSSARGKRPASQAQISRWAIYAVTLVPLVTGLLYYALDYVPRQREYFVSLRFRELSMLGGQAAEKLRGMESSLRLQAELAPKDRNGKSFIRDVLPHLSEVKPAKPPEKPRQGFYFTESAARFCEANVGCWDARLEDLLADYLGDPLFDEILFATPDKRVRLQRSSTSLRIRSLEELVKPPSSASSAAPSGWLSVWTAAGPASVGDGLKAPLLKTVELEGAAFQMFVSPVKVGVLHKDDDPLLICGLVKRGRAEGEAMQVPPVVTLLILAPIVLLLLSGPMIRLKTLTKTGRFSFRDAVLLPLSTILTLALVTAGMATYHFLSEGGRQHRHQVLSDLAGKLHARFLEDLRQRSQLLDKIDSEAAARPERIGVRTDLDLQSVEFDFVFWTDREGRQSEKWTHLKHVTPQVPQQAYSHFKDSLARTFSNSSDKDLNGLSLIHLTSPTTGRPIIVLAKASKVPDKVNTVIVAYPRSLIEPVLPPGLGFALIKTASGDTVFHASPERNLRENFYVETHAATDMIEAARSGLPPKHYDGTYRGRMQHFFLKPVDLVAGEPMAFVTFTDQAIDQRFLNEILVRVFLWYLPAVFGSIAAVWVIALALSRGPYASVEHALVQFSWPGRCSRELRLRQMAALATLLAVGALLAVFDFNTPLRWWSVGVPGGSLAIVALMQRRCEPGSPKEEPPWRVYKAKMLLLILLWSVFPVSGLFRAAFREHAQQDAVRRENQVARDIVRWRDRNLGEIEASRQLTPQSKSRLTLLMDGAPHCEPFRYAEADGLSAICGPEASAEPDAPPFRSRTPNGVRIASAQPYPFGWPASWWWLLGLSLLAVLIVQLWITVDQLFLAHFRPFDPIALRDLVQKGSADTSHLLVLGPPGAGKDAAVRDFLKPKVHVNLGDWKPGPAWIARELDTIRVSLLNTKGECVHLSHLETTLADQAGSQQVAILISRIQRDLKHLQPRIALTSITDPIGHLDGIFENTDSDEGRARVEFDIGLWASALRGFRKAIVEDHHAAAEPPLAVGHPLAGEANLHNLLRKLARLVDSEASHDKTTMARFAEKATAFHNWIYESCTRPEKLMLIQLAQSGLVNPNATSTLQELYRKRLVVFRDGCPSVFNTTFRRFLQTAEPNDRILAWEREEGESQWITVRNALFVLLVVTAAVFAANLDERLSLVSKVLSGVAALAAAVFKVRDVLAGDSSKKADA